MFRDVPFQYYAPDTTDKYWFQKIFNFSLCGSCIGRVVVRAQRHQNVEEEKLEVTSVNISHGEIVTYDGATLNTVIFTPTAQKKILESQRKYIVKFPANDDLYQPFINYLAWKAEELGVCIVSFNYRNVAGSTKIPVAFEDLVTDGIAQVQYLLNEKNIPSENILLDGHSLGGAVATKTAEYFHQKNLPIYLWNDRSFATLSKATAGIVANHSRFKEDTAASLIKCSLRSMTSWDVNAAAAYHAIPWKYKQYMVVVPDEYYSLGDEIISQKASLHYAVHKLEEKSGHKTGHVFYSGLTYPGHNVPRNTLFSKENILVNAESTYQAFVKKAFGKK